MGGGTTPTTANPVGGEMNTWADYGHVLAQQQQQNQLSQAISKGITGFGKSIASSGGQTSPAPNVPGVPTMAMPQASEQQQGPIINVYDALHRIIGGI